ncbi:MAG: ATP-binding protein, partial [Phycisphaerae bacterium]|nr:ATP-binding protein [Phycisphaerae bacterium]
FRRFSNSSKSLRVRPFLSMRTAYENETLVSIYYAKNLSLYYAKFSKRRQKEMKENLEGIEWQVQWNVESMAGIELVGRMHDLRLEPVEDFDLVRVVANLRTLLQKARPEELKEISFDTSQMMNRPICIHGNRVLLSHAVMNLVFNSIEAVQERAARERDRGRTYDGRISVSCSIESGNIVVLQIEDNGVGMSEEELQKVIAGRMRADWKVKMRGAKGADIPGYGLKFAKRIADLHGGSLKILSEQDVGTRIGLLLPQANLEGNEHVKGKAIV